MPKIKQVLQYRCLACGNLSSLPLECCGDAMTRDPWEEDSEDDYYYMLENDMFSESRAGGSR